MNTLLREIYETRCVRDGEGNAVNPFPTSIIREVGVMLYDLVKSQGLKNTLEIGLAYGLSALFICQAHQDKGGGRHAAIDPYQERDSKSIGLLNIRRAGFEDCFNFYQAPSFEALPRLCAEGKRFDLVFIDGAHLFDYVLLDFFYADRLLEAGGFVVFDDLWMPSIRQVVAYVLKNRHYEPFRAVSTSEPSLFVSALRLGRRFLQDGFRFKTKVALNSSRAVVLRKTAADDRPWNFHRPF